jgi:hypothetical protein
MIDISDRDEPLKRRQHPQVNRIIDRLMDRLDIGAPEQPSTPVPA